MSFAAEPYGVFVDDLLTSLTGGVVREERIFLAEASPFALGEAEAAQPETVRVHGLADGAYHRFLPGVDFEVTDDGELEWLARPDGAPRGGAVWPDRGSRFYVSYERRPGSGAAPLLTDRQPGSVVRLLAESFAREYAVLSKQLEKVYEAAFVDTASGRDLDQVAALVGVERRGRGHAMGEVVFARTTPAPADIFLPAGLRISSVEPPEVVVESLEKRVLAAGSLSVGVPVQALVAGPAGVAAAGTLRVLHRPVLGVTSVDNPRALRFGGADEGDEALRRRVRRALEGAGAATEHALVAALTRLDGVREQDVRVVTDHLAAPGTVQVTVAAELSEDQRRRAAELLRDTKPAGIRLLHNLDVPAPPRLPVEEGGGDEPGGGDGGGAPEEGSSDEGGVYHPIRVVAELTPADADATPARKAELRQAAEAAVQGFVDGLGVGEPVIYNRLVAVLMALDGVFDVAVTVQGEGEPLRGNLLTPSDKRPHLDAPDALVVEVRGALVAFDVTARVELLGLAAEGDPPSVLADVRQDLERRLAELAASLEGMVTPGTLQEALIATETYRVMEVSYTLELMDEGLRVRRANVSYAIDKGHTLWIRSVKVMQVKVERVEVVQE